jgi:16S rRNA (guanine966-N2)-methyltransferase
MRIIAGQFKSRHLKGTPPAGTRPTSDKLRETLFNILGESVRRCTFLDGCAGVGAVGIEAISRGAQAVVFVEQSRRAARTIRENLRLLGVGTGFNILETEIRKALDRCTRDGIVFDIAFVDPPYERDELYQDIVEAFAEKTLLATSGILVLEHTKRKTLPENVGHLKKARSLIQGDSALTFYRPETL